MSATWTPLGGWPRLMSDTLNPGQRLAAVTQSPGGRLELFALGTDGGVWHLWQSQPGVWVPAEWWMPHGVPPRITLGGPDPERRIGPVAARSPDGRLEVLALGDDGAVWRRAQLAPDGHWPPPDAWVSHGRPGAPKLVDLAVEANADGRLELFALGDDGAVWHTWQIGPGGAWGDRWYALAEPRGVAFAGVSVGGNADGRLEVAGVGRDGDVWHTWQVAPNGTWVGTWAALGRPRGVTLSRPAVGRSVDGRLTIFAAGSDGALWHVGQTGPRATWLRDARWISRGAPPGAGPIVGALGVGASQDGRLEVLAWFADGTIQGTHQTARGGGWLPAGQWVELAAGTPDPASVPLVAVAGDGCVEVLVVDGKTGDVLRARQAAPNGVWG